MTNLFFFFSIPKATVQDILFFTGMDRLLMNEAFLALGFVTLESTIISSLTYTEHSKLCHLCTFYILDKAWATIGKWYYIVIVNAMQYCAGILKAFKQS